MYSAFRDFSSTAMNAREGIVSITAMTESAYML
jgi:hypothetical protein